MQRLSDNYYNRKYYLETDQTLTFGIIKKNMRCPTLTKILLKNLLPKQKIMAGLEPPLVGGGSNWYMPPQDLLQRRAVLKPDKVEHISMLGYTGIEYISTHLMRKRLNELVIYKINALKESDRIAAENISETCKRLWDEKSKEESEKVSRKINLDFTEFTKLYTSTLNNLEDILLQSATKQIEELTTQVHTNIITKYESLVKEQACRLSKKYEDLLDNAKQKLKNEFINNELEVRSDLSKKYHDINVEKHTAIEKLRNLLENRNLACQVYVALKEREECQREIQVSRKEHLKQVKALKETIATQDFKISLEIEKEKQRTTFKNIWKAKVCQVVKKFQKFVEYSLMDLPELADFFINTEKVLLLQLVEAAEDSEVQNAFHIEKASPKSPTAAPHPYHLFCDKGYQLKVDYQLCPKHCTSSASQFPVIVINNKCMYAACDDFPQFTEKIKKYIKGHREDDIDLEDDHDHTYDIRVDQSPSNKIFELKLESSLMQVLQKEYANMRELPIVCETCRSTYCFCSPLRPSKTTVAQDKTMIYTCGTSSSTETRLPRYVELHHEREPRIESYIDSIKTKKCSCATTAKKFLREHLPPYMIKTSEFQQFEFPFYERCPVETMKKMVRGAKLKGRRIITKPKKIPSKMNEQGIQCEDLVYAELCQCMSESELTALFESLHYAYKGIQKQSAKVVDGGLTPSYLADSKSSFATNRARSLRHLVNDPDLINVFRNEDCKYD